MNVQLLSEDIYAVEKLIGSDLRRGTRRFLQLIPTLTARHLTLSLLQHAQTHDRFHGPGISFVDSTHSCMLPCNLMDQNTSLGSQKLVVSESYQRQRWRLLSHLPALDRRDSAGQLCWDQRSAVLVSTETCLTRCVEWRSLPSMHEENHCPVCL
jgi:hypothetical protein